MFKKIVFIIPLICLVLLSGCKLLEPPKEAKEFALKYLDSLLDKKYEETYNIFSVDARNQTPKEKHKEVIDIIVKEFGKHDSAKIVGWHITHIPEKKIYDLTFELKYPETWSLFSIRLSKMNEQISVDGYNISPLSDSLENLNKFTLKGKRFINYLFLLLMIVEALFVIYSLYLCVRSKIRKKILWLLFVFCGFVNISLNWSTGAINIQPLSVEFMLGISFLKQGPYAPWVLTITVPLGAIIFLIKRRKLIQAVEAKNKI